MLKLSNSLLHYNGKMMMMVFTNWILNDDQIKFFTDDNFVYLV